MYFTTRKFWTDLTERAMSTAAQAALGGVTADGFGLIDLGSWQGVGVLAGTAAVIAVLKAFAVGRGRAGGGRLAGPSVTPDGPDLPSGDGSLIIAAPSATLEHLQRRADELGSTPLFTNELIPALYSAAVHYGIDPTVMVAQSAHETGFAKFGRAVTPEHHNTCGLKVKRPVGPDDNPDDHMRFPDWETGAKAHAQHLLAYADVPLPPGEPDLDPRAVWVRPHNYGIKRMRGLGGHWAPSPTYGNRVEDMAHRLLED